MRKIVMAAVGVMVFAGGLLAGRLLRPQPQPPSEPTATRTAASGVEDGLRRQVADLLQERVRLSAELAALRQAFDQRPTLTVTSSAVAADEPRRGGPRGEGVRPGDNRRASPEEHLAQLQRDDPERAAEMAQRIEGFRQRMREQAAARDAILEAVDAKKLTEAQRSTHEQLLQAVAQARTLSEQLPTLSGAPAEEARNQLREISHTLPELYEQERRTLLEQAGQSVGYSPAEAGQFADYVEQIYDSTSFRPPRGGRGGRPPDFPGGGGAPRP